jgi:hypothetical protein
MAVLEVKHWIVEVVNLDFSVTLSASVFLQVVRLPLILVEQEYAEQRQTGPVEKSLVFLMIVVMDLLVM